MIKIRTTIPPAKISIENFSHWRGEPKGPLTYLECIPDGSDEGIPGEIKFPDHHIYRVNIPSDDDAGDKLREMGFAEFEVVE